MVKEIKKLTTIGNIDNLINCQYSDLENDNPDAYCEPRDFKLCNAGGYKL